MARMCASSSKSSVFTSCEVRKPSKKLHERHAALQRRRLRDQREIVRLLHRAAGQHGEAAARTAMTSVWSPKIDSACVATARAAMWKTVEVSSPAILNMLGSISSRPCEAVNVVVSAPDCSAPCVAAGGARLALHLLDDGDVAPDVGHAGGRPFVGEFGHRRGWRDRVDRADLVDAVGDVGDGGVAVHGGFHGVASGTISMAWHGHCSKQAAQPVHLAYS